MQDYSVVPFFEALLIISVFIIAAYAIKRLLFNNIIFPASLLAGILALIFGPEILGTSIANLGFLKGKIPIGFIPDKSLQVWKKIPEYLITIVFAGLFLGKEIPSTKQIINNSLPNLSFGYSLALGQYVVGLLCAVLILSPLFKVNILSGALIAIGFQGGHGTVAGLQSSFKELGYANGTDLGLGIATIGIIVAIVFGTIMLNFSKQTKQENDDMHMSDEESNSLRIKKVSFTLQIAVVGFTIVLAWLFLKLLGFVETQFLSSEQFRIIKFIPLFPMALLSGLVVQKIAVKIKVNQFISRNQIRFISGVALDILIVAALGSLSIKTLASSIYPLLILAGIGVLYNMAIYFLLAPKFFGRNWKSRGLGELGQSMGTTAIGLILLKRKSSSSPEILNAFSYKQPFYEPIVGGGLITAIALPLIAEFGVWYFLSGIGILMLAIGFLAYKTISKNRN